jgi:hypothetical protein
LSLIFAAGRRPSAVDVQRIAAARLAGPGSFSITQSGDTDADGDSFPSTVKWLELLTSGLTFDLSGLMPGASTDMPKARHLFGITRDETTHGVEALEINPGLHLEFGAALLPVVRAMVGLSCELAQLPGVVALCWHSAGTWMSAAYFTRMVEQWLIGGAFPALGLTALKRTADGGVESEGLAFLVGRECRIEPDISVSPAESAKLAIRVIHHLIEGNRINVPTLLAGPNGEHFQAAPSTDGRFVQIWRKS